MSTMNDPPDPILDELHATRRRLLQEHGGVTGLARIAHRPSGVLGISV